MKLKKVKIIVEPVNQLSKRWTLALKGKMKKDPKGIEVISVASWEILGKIFSAPRLQILAAIPVLQSKSIAQLAKKLGKNFKNVYSDVRFLADLGLIELKEEGGRKTLVPIPRYAGIEFPLAA